MMKTTFDTITEAATSRLQQRLSGTWKPTSKNYIWKISDPTIKGDGGEEIVGGIFQLLFDEIYDGFTVTVKVVGGDKGDYDVIITVQELDITIKIEVKTATLDSKNKFQFNGLKKHIDYDYAFGLGVRPDDFLFIIQPRSYLEDTLTTNMNRDVIGSYKWSVPTNNCKELDPINFRERLEELNLLGECV